MIILILFLIIAHATGQVYITAPRLVSQNGNLKIYPGYNRNISLEVSGDKSWINIGPYNLLHVLEDAINATHNIDRVYKSISTAQDSFIRMTRRQLNGRRGILRRLADLEIGQGNSTIGNLPVRRRQFQQLKTRVNTLRRRVTNLETRFNSLIQNDACSSTPCVNGGTCIENIKGYQCICPSNWEGPQCNTDVNECSHFAGTDLGCQNGATCTNTPGSYECRCMTGWFGLHCTKRSGDCSSSSNEEMCGHGICISQNNALGYKCICDQGWKTDGNSPACTKDVNECEGNHYPCSVIPMVPCINMPGTFLCGSCPAGYTGNGYYCTDINECLSNNGGCSTNPNVECINTVGSRMCGECPPGYQGNGIICTFVGVCQVNNGGCHIFADCISNPMIGPSFVQCQCKAGYTGSGYGPMGCTPLANYNGVPTPPPNAILQAHCDPNPCVHGICQQTPSGRQCVCEARYIGALCDQLRDPCVPQPCLNGATCIGDNATMGYRCECTPQFTGHSCEQRTAACGGVRDMPEGRIVYPDSNSTNYSHNARCAWVIVTQSNKVLNVTFTRFNLEVSSDCLYDWLQIHDGRNSASHYIGRFCGNKLPMGGNIISTRNVLYLWFRSDHTVSKNGFEMSWTSIDPMCGSNINATSHGIIKSPGSPGKYPNNRDCMWVLTAPPDKRIQFHFYTLQIELSPDCEHDYLAVYEGTTVDDKELVKYCGSIHPAPLLVPSPSALIYFRSDALNNDYGFQISYTVVEGESGCGATYTQERGEIVPPKVNGMYTSQSTCEYRIKLTPDTLIKLTFVEFSLEQSSSCQFDYVAVYDGDTRESGLIGKYCGNTLPPILLSTSNRLLVVFVSDATYAGEGFRILYEKVCHNVYEGLSGIVKSPGYPKAYPDQLTCTYLINVPAGNAIVINFIDFDIEQPTYGACGYDYLKIYDGDKALNSTVIGKYCGNNENKPAEIVSTHNYIYMEFNSDVSISGTGFQLNYTSVAIGCGGIYREYSGNVEYPDTSKEKYENNKQCTWILSAPSGYVIQIMKTMFDLEFTNKCTADFVEISNMDTLTGNNEILGRFCGSDFPMAITSLSNMLTIKFQSDISQVANGFSFHYLFSDVRKVCGGTYLSSSGVISSPGWPEQYPAKKDCSWVVRAPEGQQVMLNVSKFELERHSDCAGDYLEIRNGGYENSPLIGKYCGTDIPLKIPSLTNLMYIHFHSDMSRNYMGFYITWDSTTTGCGGVLTSSRGSIISPNFPNRYGHDAECYWRITTSAGTQIRLTFASLDLEHATFCVFDYVEIFDGDDLQRDKIGRYCSMESIHGPIVSKSNHVFVRFRTDTSTAGLGFMLNYNTHCNRNLTELNGIIESPNFPNKYPDQMDCVWIIKAPKGNKINITFSHFDLEEALHRSVFVKKFDFDYVALKDGLDSNYSKVYFGNKLPPHYQSSDNLAFVHFHTDFSHRQTGFRLEWAVDGCGGYLRHPSDSFTSPGYPNLYPVDTECQWIIEVDHDKSIELKINDLDTELIQHCQFDSLMIYNGPSDQYPLLVNLCGKHQANYTIVTSTGNYLFVKFHSDLSVTSRGFKATYKSIDSKCGGAFQGFNGIVTSPSYPKNYEDNLECFYYLEVPEFHIMSLQFTDFDVNFLSGNCSDYVKVYDGDSITANLLGTFCHPGTKDIIRSTSNKLTIEFKSDDTFSAKGFSANYTMLCGSKITTSTEGVISRNNIYVLDGDNCTWTIISENLEDKVSLTFTFLEMETDEDCRIDYVEVFGGESPSSPSLGKFCGNKSPPMIVSRGNALTIQLVASSLVSFSFHYSVLKTACGGNLTSEMGEFTSPMYPDSYGSNMSCVWIINVSPGTGITLSFNEFKLQTSENCEQDYVEVREGDGVGRLIGVYCDEAPSTIKSFKNLWIKFSSDSEGTNSGFIAQYSYDKKNDIQDTDVGQLTSPLYPRYYTKAATYEWRITVSPGAYILLTFKQIFIPMYSLTCYNSLEIFDGYSDDAPILGSYCGTEVPDPISTTGNVVYIKLILNRVYLVGSIFNLEWMRMSLGGLSSEPNKNCGGNHSVYITESNFVLKSPGYPEGYNHTLNCEWIFETSPTQHLLLKFNDVSLEDTMNCVSDKISVYSGDKTSKDWTMIGSRICQPNATQMDYIEVNNLMKIVFETDISVNKTGFEAVIFPDCGNTLTQSSGIITSARPLDLLLARRHLADCEWDVSVRNGRTIKVEFLKLNLVNSDNSCSIYVMVRDGGNMHSPLLGKGKFCDSVLPETPLITSSNRLHVTFHLPVPVISMIRHMANASFEIRYSEVTLPCGDKITLTDEFNSTEITSPNYPEIPNPHSECSWTFVGQAGHRLSLNFIDRFDLTSSKGCEEEFVEIRDGGTELSPLLGRYCTKPANTIMSTNNMLYLKFITDIPVPKNGFKAKISVDICGGTVYGTRGQITSPSMLQLAFATNDIVCDWHIVVPSTHIIYMNIRLYTSFVEDDCSLSNVQVFDAHYNPLTNETYTPLTEKLCPRSGPSMTVTTPSNEALVRYSIPKSLVHKGIFSFLINFNTSEETCGGDFNQPSGVIELPRYQVISGGRGCEWRLTVPEGRRIKLEFVENDTLSDAQPLPAGFWIGVFNGHNTNLLLTFFLRSSNTSRVVESSSNKMYIMFLGRFKNNRAAPPFKMIYSSDEPSVCDGQFAYGEGIILPPTPSFPKAYCEYPYKTIDEYFNGTIMVEHNDNNPNVCDSAKFNYLVYVSVPGIKNFGNLCPRKIILSPYVNTVINVQRANNATAGYVVHYKVYHCGGVVNDMGDLSNVLVLPTNYTGTLRCVWVINIPRGTTLEINPDRAVFGSQSCDDEYLKIKSEKTIFTFLYNKICHNQIPKEVMTYRDPSIWIEYFANNFTSSTNLNMTFSTRSEDKSNLWVCGGELNWPTPRSFATPNFPRQYTENKECEWILNGEDGYRVALKFENRFHIETSPNCTKDYVEISDFQKKTWTVIGRYCGRNVPPVINSTAERLKVLFHSDESTNTDGFQATWSLFCGGKFEVTSESQRLKSPGRGIYGRNLDCEYVLNQPEDAFINLKFEYFLLEAGSNRICKFDNLTISAPLEEDEAFCGSNSPGYKRLRGPVTLRFMTDKWVQRRGYSIIYSLDSCGGNITKSGETISSSTHNNVYFPSIECKWLITAPSDKTIAISFQRLVLEYSSECDYDYVLMYEGFTITEDTKPMAKLCGNLTSHLPVFKTKGNEMTVIFKTDSTNQWEGFAAKIDFSYGESHGCGGQINVTKDSTPLHIFADKEIYEPYLDCHWVFKAPVDNFVTLRFTEFNVSKCYNSSVIRNCDCDYLEVRDGLSSHSELIGKYCGDALPDNITSSKNFLWIRFVSDGTVQSSGIQVYAFAEPSICGPSLLNITNEIQVLESPGFSSGKLPKNIKCDWVLSTSTLNVHFHFTDFDVGMRPLYGNHCDTEYVQLIYEKTATEDNSHIISRPIENYPYSFNSDPYVMSSSSTPRYFCGNLTTYEDFIFYTNVRIRLVSSNSEIRHAGFRLEYSDIGCSRNYTKSYSRIVSRMAYQAEPQDCKIYIIAPVNHTISVYFYSYSSDVMDCENSYLQAYDGIGDNSKLFGKYCAMDKLALASTSNIVFIDLVGGSARYQTYEFSFVTTDKGVGCGGNILDRYGTIYSPLFPDTYRENNTCEWTINSPDPSIALTFKDYDFGFTKNCESNYVEFIDENGLSLTKYCTRTMPAPFVVLSNYVKIVYRTNRNNHGTGWILSFTRGPQ